MAEAIDGGGIDPIDAEIDGMTHGLDRSVVVLWSPAEGPSTSADCPSAKSDRSDFKIARSKTTFRKIHSFSLHQSSIVQRRREPCRTPTHGKGEHESHPVQGAGTTCVGCPGIFPTSQVGPSGT